MEKVFRVAAGDSLPWVGVEELKDAREAMNEEDSPLAEAVKGYLFQAAMNRTKKLYRSR